MYTNEDWKRDGIFKAYPGQEISFQIYDTMFNCMPPFRLPRCAETQGFSAGFMMSEPFGFTKSKPYKLTYLAFGKKDGAFYYIGVLPL